jgi:hypothetical protein
MSTAFSFNQESGLLTMMLNNNPVVINTSHRYFSKIKSLLISEADEADILKLVNKAIIKARDISKASNGKVTLKNGRVMLNGKELHNAMVTRVYDFIREDLPFQHLLSFMENVFENPSCRAQDELFTFLEHQNLPITDDGCFYAYKAVGVDYMDLYSHTINNGVGNTIKMKRPMVDDDCTRGCSKGLHCGTLEYATQYGRSGSRMLIVKVNPKNVVSVPKDCSCQKVRVCEYLVHSEYSKPLTDPTYNDDLRSYSSMDDYEDDLDWNDI